MAKRGNLIIVSGPSGSGKSVLVEAVMKTLAGIRFSVSYTTRPPRGNERDGIDYRFISPEEFKSLRESDGLLEWAQVHGNFYGTAKQYVDDVLREGDDVLLDIDVQGAKQVRMHRPEAVSVFIMPPSFETLKDRLKNRRLDDEDIIAQRLQRATEEIYHYRDYDYLVVNRVLAKSARELTAIIQGSRCRMPLRADCAQSILSTFGGMDAENA
jgi:guanylate kinase